MRRLAWLPLAALCLAAAVVAVAVGPVRLSLGEVWGALAGNADATVTAIVREVRLPRVALALLVGAALGMSGAVLQGTLRNALAEPYLLGVSGGAAVGAVVMVSAGATAPAAVSLAAFGGAVTAVALVLGIARAAGARGDPRVLLMAGVVIGAFANAAILVLLANAPGDTVRGALWWMMGSVGAAEWNDAAWLAGALLVAGAPLVHWSRDLDALALGHDSAAALGVEADAASRRLFLAASLLAAASVASAGLVGFVGLIVPHIARRLVGVRHRAVLAVAAIAGAALLVLADLAARTARAPAELPLGAVTALLGVPFFLTLLRRAR
ncbi:MAG TPA: iron ABC transporter permease [Gemmatimonadaceae bacterium]|nr:iron ABC transporter permease [Gemmatimonadaceae bacterium]